MKLGTQTASLVNHVMANQGAPETISIGDPATILGWSDRHPATVIHVFKKGKYFYIEVQQDSAKWVGDVEMSDSQEWEYSRDPNGRTTTWRIDNGFKRVDLSLTTGRYLLSGTGGLIIGRREKFYDYSF